MKTSDQLEILAATVQRMVEESGSPEDFDALAWLEGWLTQTVPALGFKKPAEVLKESGGFARVQQILSGMQSGAFF